VEDMENPNNKRILLRIPHEMYDMVQDMAAINAMSMNMLICNILADNMYDEEGNKKETTVMKKEEVKEKLKRRKPEKKHLKDYY
jgi:hypothetical protein